MLYLQILDFNMGLPAYIIKKIYDRKNIRPDWYLLPVQNNCAIFLRHLSDWYIFLDLDLDKLQSLINLRHSYFWINLHKTLIQPNMQKFTVPVIVLAIIAYFFIGIDSYSFDQKMYTACFFSLFWDEIIVVIGFILVVTIKNLAVKQNNKTLVTEKNAVQFKPASQKKASNI